MTNLKDLMNQFKPMTEEQQKDLLFVLLDTADYHDAMQRLSEKDGDESIAQYHRYAYNIYYYVATAMLDYGSLECPTLKAAHLMRASYESGEKE